MTCADCRHCVIRWLDVLQQMPSCPCGGRTLGTLCAPCADKLARRVADDGETVTALRMACAESMGVPVNEQSREPVDIVLAFKSCVKRLREERNALRAFVAAYDAYDKATHLEGPAAYGAMLKAREALPI